MKRASNAARLLAVLTAAALCLFVVACGGDDSSDTTAADTGTTETTETESQVFELANGNTFELSPEIQERVANGEKLKFTFVSFNTSSPFWGPVKKGIEDAAAEFDVDVQFVGPTGTNSQEQVNLMRTAVRTGADGIVAVNADPDTLGPVIDEIVESGVPVFTSNIDGNPDSNRIAFVGQELVQSGRTAGEEIVRALDAMDPNWQDNPIKVAAFGGDPSASYVGMRVDGMTEVLGEYENVEILGPIKSTYDPAQTLSAVADTIKANPDVRVIYFTDGMSVAGCQYVEREDKIGELVNVGFNFEAGTEECMKSGAMSASIGQYPYKQGYEPVQHLVTLVRDGQMPECAPDCFVGDEVANQENVDSFDFAATG